MLESDESNSPVRSRVSGQQEATHVHGTERSSPRPSSRKQRHRPIARSAHERALSGSNPTKLSYTSRSDDQNSFAQSPASTPTRPLSTPSKPAYAGSTFSASPAPSSLPIPRLLSKLTPESEGKDSNRNMESDESPEQLGRSPGRVTATATDGGFVPGSSPLDIFFRADREERARARHGSQPDLRNADAFDPRRLAFPDSPSPSSGKPRRTRGSYQSDLSATGMPAADGATGSTGTMLFNQHLDTSGHGRQNVMRSHTAPSAVAGLNDEEAHQRRLKSQALKDLLGV